MKDMIRVGDWVMWKGTWGSDAPRRVRITGMQLCAAERQKYGVPVTEVPATLKNYINFDLSSGNWAYGYQIELVSETESASVQTKPLGAEMSTNNAKGTI